jgi:formylglycine-generating enzyme
MYCRECGREIPDTAKYCEHCGGSVGKAKSEQMPAKKAPYLDRTRLIIAIILLVVVIGITGLLFLEARTRQKQAVWPEQRGPFGTGASQLVGPERPSIKWRVDIGPNQSSPVVASDGMIYITSEIKNLSAITPNGQVKWLYKTGAILFSPTLGTDGTIYIRPMDSYLYAIEPNGKEKWKRQVGEVTLFSSIIRHERGGDFIYTGANDGSLDIFNQRGFPIGQVKLDGSILSPPAIGADGTVYVVTNLPNFASKLYAIKPQDTSDKVKWEKDFSGCLLAPIVGKNGAIYVRKRAPSDADDTLITFTPDGDIQWNIPMPSGTGGSPSLGYDGTIYATCGTTIIAFDPRGKIKWTLDAASRNEKDSWERSFGSPVSIDANGVVYTASGPHFLAITPDGQIKWQIDLPGSPKFPQFVGITGLAIGRDHMIYVSNGAVLFAIGELPPAYNGEPGTKIGDVCVNPKDGAEMMWVPAGEFIMGSTEEQTAAALKRRGGSAITKFFLDSEKPQRKVYLDGYWMYRYEVTVAQYRKFCDATKREMPEAPSQIWKDDHPMSWVNYQDAADYAKWAGVSLPTEAQWEKAARGADGRIFPWGNLWDAAKCASSGESTQPVGSYAAGASPYGNMDMAGNVWEWCADWYYPDYYRNAPAKNPTGPSAPVKHSVPGIIGEVSGARVLHGGSFGSVDSDYFRCAYRCNNYDPIYRNFLFGFRCAKVP